MTLLRDPEDGYVHNICKHGKIRITTDYKPDVDVSHYSVQTVPLLPDYPRMKCIECVDPIVKPNVIIYILCHNYEKFIRAKYAYAPYYWAKPIFIKYQDVTFENAFYRQLLEIKDEWEEKEMVGCISASAIKKIDIKMVDNIINNRTYWYSGYYNFYCKEIHKDDNPNQTTIINDIVKGLDLVLPIKHYFCNYWMCTPYAMKMFIKWSQNTLIPAVLEHSLSYEDYNYEVGALTKKECSVIFGLPYYPYVPFILERLNVCFFTTYFKDLIL